MAENAENLRKMLLISSDEEVCFGDVRHANACSRRKRLRGNSLGLMRFKGKVIEAALRLSILKTSGLPTNARAAAMNGQT
jgi:hypothetical protein